MKIRRVHLCNVAGYRTVEWAGVQPDLNMILGRNGAGKSTLLQALSYGLNMLAGRRTESILLRTYPDGEIEIEAASGESWGFSFGHIRKDRLWDKAGKVPLKVYYAVENRQPKNTVGDIKNIRTDLQQHHMNRYPNAASQLKLWLESGDPRENELARKVLEICRGITAAGSPRDWEWIEAAVLERSSQKARPLSCGQFDLVALALDLVRLHSEVVGSTEPVFILLDNPETYLHPACQEPTLRLVRTMFPQAQVFISSHSLKLLCHREPKSVFWLSREAQDEYGDVKVQSVRGLTEGAKRAFFELYGDDLNSAVLGLLHAFESPEYYKFLCECALTSEAVVRPHPNRDRQMMAVGEQVVSSTGSRTILDYGAGNGDLLAALLIWGKTDSGTTYVAVETGVSSYLERRIEEAKSAGKISANSKVISDLDDAPPSCDVIVLANVCHEILPPQLPALLARLLTAYLIKTGATPGRIVIHEVETLSAGEIQFVMWSPEDYRSIFRDIEGVRVDIAPRPPLPGGVPLDTTIISTEPGESLPPNLEGLLVERFREQLPVKKSECLAEIETLWSQVGSGKGGDFQEALRQRRLAFLVAQVTSISLLERRGG